MKNMKYLPIYLCDNFCNGWSREDEERFELCILIVKETSWLLLRICISSNRVTCNFPKNCGAVMEVATGEFHWNWKTERSAFEWWNAPLVGESIYVQIIWFLAVKKDCCQKKHAIKKSKSNFLKKRKEQIKSHNIDH